MGRSQRVFVVTAAFLLATVVLATAFPAEDPKSAFGMVFDEIVVRSDLTVLSKGSGLRIGRTKKLEGSSTTESSSTTTSSTSAPLKRYKRQRSHLRPRFPGFPNSSASSAQAAAQDFTVNGPLGSWGASASHAGSQGFSAGPGGLSGGAGMTASQQYRFPNGFTADVAFSGGFSYGPDGASQSGGATVTITAPDGSKRVIQG